MAARKVSINSSVEITINGFNYIICRSDRFKYSKVYYTNLTIKSKDHLADKIKVLSVEIYTNELDSMNCLERRTVTLKLDTTTTDIMSNASADPILNVFVREFDTKTAISNMPKQYLDAESSLKDDFSRFLCDEGRKDVTFKVGEKEIKAHSAVLSARSSVFDKMLSNEMKEKTG